MSESMSNFDRARIGYDKMDTHDKKIWNTVIEEALKWLNEKSNWQTWNDPKDAEQIRSLKK